MVNDPVYSNFIKCQLKLCFSQLIAFENSNKHFFLTKSYLNKYTFTLNSFPSTVWTEISLRQEMHPKKTTITFIILIMMKILNPVKSKLSLVRDQNLNYHVLFSLSQSNYTATDQWYNRYNHLVDTSANIKSKICSEIFRL